MEETKVVNCRDEEYDVYIGKGGIWGNPFIIGTNGNREEVLELYKNYIENKPQLIELLYHLKGRRLGCPGNCKPLACHGDVLVELIEKYKV